MQKWVLFSFGVFLSLFMSSASSWALPTTKRALCFQKERDPQTGRAFVSAEEHQARIQSWSQESPGVANPLALLKAYSVYRSEMAMAQKMGHDKRMHCYLGCRIAQETSFHTAHYVGWLKEARDLSDCNYRSRFEEEDFQVTVQGAQFGSTNPDPESCKSSCQ